MIRDEFRKSAKVLVMFAVVTLVTANIIYLSRGESFGLPSTWTDPLTIIPVLLAATLYPLWRARKQ